MKRILSAFVMLAAIGAASAAQAQGVYPNLPPKPLPIAPLLQPGQELKPGDIFRDCEGCPEMVVVPAGLFVMGSKKDKNEQPLRVVRFKKPFAISRFEITHDDWQTCLDQAGCTEQPNDHHWGRHRMPVINVNHAMVQGFAKWLAGHTGKAYRLPSEAEWEYVARAGTKSDYWFGDDVGENLINCRKCGTPWSGIGNAPVGSFEPNPWGVYDMLGNAYEWVEDCWHDDYTGAPKGPEARVDGNCQVRVIRGGSWYYYSRMSRASTRQKNPAAVKSYWLSFRVVRPL